MARALYRTYRSRSLDEVAGQEHITDLLKQALAKGAISHAYLLTGPRGTGKTSVARILAHQVNDLPYSDDPHLDIIEIDAASNRRIDDIRELRDKVRIAPVSAKYKVYIIDEVHMLTTESFNALLKTLEEPPEHVVFILATTEAHKLPATILSRTQRFHFRPVSEDKVAAHLAGIARKEKIEVDKDALKLIARHGDGSFRDSISLLDQLSAGGTRITLTDVELTLGLVAGEQILQLLDHLLAGRTKPLLQQLHALYDDGAPAVVISQQLLRELSGRADEQPELYGLCNELLEVSRAYDPFIKLTAILVNYCETRKPRTAAAHAAGSTPGISVRVAAPIKPPATTGIQSSHAAGQNTPAKSAASGTFDWNAVLATAKKHNAPLHSVLSRARMEYADNVVTLHFIYALHRKKLEQPHYRAQVASLIYDVCRLSPEIAVTDGRVMDEQTSTVRAIMGGGELTHV